MSIASGARLVAGMLLALVTAPAALGQSVWTEMPRRSAAQAEAYFPTGPVSSGMENPTVAVFLLGQFPIGKVDVRVEVPVASAGPEGERETIPGNVYLGIAYPPELTPGVLAEIGVRLPTAPDHEGINPAHRVGTFADHSRGAIFSPHILTLSAAATYSRRLEFGFSGRIHGRPMLLLDTSGETDFRLLFVHLAHLYYTFAPLRAGVGVGGTFIATDVPESGLSKRTSYELGFSLDADAGVVRPGLLVRLPLENTLDDNLDVVWGVNLTVRL